MSIKTRKRQTIPAPKDGFFIIPRGHFASGWAVNAVTNCDGPEGVMGKDAVGPDGPGGGLADITGDMIAQCVPRTH